MRRGVAVLSVASLIPFAFAGCDVVMGIPSVDAVLMLPDASATAADAPDSRVVEGGPLADVVDETPTADASGSCPAGPAATLARWIVYDHFNPPTLARHIYAMRADGCGGMTRLTNRGPGNDEYEPAVSPDGSRLAFISTTSSGPQVFVLNFNDATTLGRQLTNIQIESPSHPAWSPDGTTIALAGSASGILTVRSDGSGMTQLVAKYPDPPERNILSEPAFVNAHTILANGQTTLTLLEIGIPVVGERNTFLCSPMAPSVSADGMNVAFLTELDGNGPPWVARVAPVSAETCDEALTYPADGSLKRTAMGPNGIVATVYDGAQPGTKVSGLVLLALTGPFPLTTDATDDHPSWAPASFQPPPN